MFGESDSSSPPELTSLQFVALGLIGGVASITAVLVGALFIALDGKALLGDDEFTTLLGYGSLLLVPVALAGAFLVAPSLSRGQARGPTLAAYSGQFFLQAGLLEGPAILMLVMFLLTACWALLGGVLVLLAGLIFIFPTAEKYRTWAADRTTAA